LPRRKPRRAGGGWRLRNPKRQLALPHSTFFAPHR
jgi:hypothetical protein